MTMQRGWTFRDPQYLAIDGQQITADQLTVTLTVTPEHVSYGPSWEYDRASSLGGFTLWHHKLIIHAVGNIRAAYNIRSFTPLLITVGPEGTAAGKPKHEQLFEFVDGTRAAGGGEWDELKLLLMTHEPPIADIANGGAF